MIYKNKNKEKPKCKKKGYLKTKSVKKSVKSKVRSVTRGKKNAKIIKGGNPGHKDTLNYRKWTPNQKKTFYVQFLLSDKERDNLGKELEPFMYSGNKTTDPWMDKNYSLFDKLEAKKSIKDEIKFEKIEKEKKRNKYKERYDDKKLDLAIKRMPKITENIYEDVIYDMPQNKIHKGIKDHWDVAMRMEKRIKYLTSEIRNTHNALKIRSEKIIRNTDETNDITLMKQYKTVHDEMVQNMDEAVSTAVKLKRQWDQFIDIEEHLQNEQEKQMKKVFYNVDNNINKLIKKSKKTNGGLYVSSARIVEGSKDPSILTKEELKVIYEDFDFQIYEIKEFKLKQSVMKFHSNIMKNNDTMRRFINQYQSVVVGKKKSYLDNLHHDVVTLFGTYEWYIYYLIKIAHLSRDSRKLKNALKRRQQIESRGAKLKELKMQRPKSFNNSKGGNAQDIKTVQNQYLQAKKATQQLMYNFTHYIPFKNMQDLSSKNKQKTMLQQYVTLYYKAYDAMKEEFEIKDKMKIAYDRAKSKLYPDIKENEFEKIWIKLNKSFKEHKKLSDKSIDLINKSLTESNYTKGFFMDISNVLPKWLNITYEMNQTLFTVIYYLDKFGGRSFQNMGRYSADLNKMLLSNKPQIMTAYA